MLVMRELRAGPLDSFSMGPGHQKTRIFQNVALFEDRVFIEVIKLK